MSEDLWTDHVKLESPSILTKKILFCPAIGQRRSQEFSCEPNFGEGRAPLGCASGRSRSIMRRCYMLARYVLSYGIMSVCLSVTSSRFIKLAQH